LGTTTTSTTFYDNVTAALSDRQREIALLLSLLACTFSMLALLGYDPLDPTFLTAGEGAVANPCGPVGALLADGLFRVVGNGAWVMFLAMIYTVMSLAGRTRLNWVVATASAVLYLSGLPLLELLLGGRGWFPYPPGGLIGSMEAGLLEATVGTAGAWLGLLGVATLAITILGNIRWSQVATRGVETAENWLPRAGAGARSGLVRVRGWSMTGLRFVGGRVASGGRAGVAGGWGAMRRMFRSLRRNEGDYIEDQDFTSPSHLESLHGDPFAAPEQPSDPTAVGSPIVAVAEVEWEPTAELSSSSSELLEMFPDLAPRQSTAEPSSVSPPGPGTWVDKDIKTSPSDAPPSMVASANVPPAVVSVPAPAPAAAVVTPPHAPVAAPPNAAVPTSGAPVHIAAALNRGPVKDDGKALKRARRGEFQLPKLSLLDVVPPQEAMFDGDQLRELAATVEDTLSHFKVKGEVTDIRVGPVVTTFEFLPVKGTPVRRIANLGDDLAMSLKAKSVRIVAPIPGKGVVGIEIPSPQRMMIYFRELMASKEMRETQMALPCVIGKDVEGRPVVADLAKMPHLLVAGTTGSGKSVGVNGMLMSMMYARSPSELRLLLVDPKVLEFKMYDDIPHLIHPVVTDPKKAAAALAWACREMDDRYELLARWDTRNIANYNKKVEKELAGGWSAEKARRYAPKDWPEYDAPPAAEKLPYIVIVIDELADLMMVAKKDVETSIARIAQKARACGIHLIVATQRPSADVVTGLIKANLPARIAFTLRSALDSRIIIEQGGAERLLSMGDMLYLPNAGDVMRCHGAFCSDEEVGRVVAHLREQGEPQYIEDITKEQSDGGAVAEQDRDPLYFEAVQIVQDANKASTSMIQRHLKIGYNRAARIIDQMELSGVIGPADGARPREVL